MNVLNTTDELAFLKAKQESLLGMGGDALQNFAGSMQDLCRALTVLAEAGDDNSKRRCERMMRQLDGFEPSVTMIGQIKSGKTSLVNALVGAPDLLPADVNPWTSVVTSLHLNPERPDFEQTATFKFFDADEWERLVSGGGRIGELASRAGADDELEKIKAQVAEMREKSRARLGRKFEMLLGQQRDYGYFDKDLIERYVCLGEEPDEDDATATDVQGRFADITKSADLHLTRVAMPMRLCIRDTPGVNDTFMMREQITIRAIRDSRICVVVLSAHQALSSTDMALIRLISHSKSRDVIIFVNRSDELSDPAVQIPQIRDSIASTLKKHKGPEDAEVIFGSALWASHALQMRIDDLPGASKSALQKWTAARLDGSVSFEDPELAWQASGLPDLQAAIADRVSQGAGSTLLQRIGASAGNIASGIAAANKMTAASPGGQTLADLSIDAAREKMQALTATHSRHLRTTFDGILSGFSERLDRVQDNFLERATGSLLEHLERFGELSPWTYDPAGLRVLLSSSHKVLARNSVSAFDKATRAAAQEIAQVYAAAFGLGADDLDIAVPRAPQVPAPVTLGRTIALDLSQAWWKRWWMQKRGYKAYAASFHELIKTETTPVIDELRNDLALAVRDEAIAEFETFLNEQQSIFETLENSRQADPAAVQEFARTHSCREQRASFAAAIETFKEYASS